MKRKVWLGVAALAAMAAAACLTFYLGATRPEAIQHELAVRFGAQAQVGSVERVWWGGPGVEVKQVRLAATSFALEAETVRLRVRLLPLLWGARELARVELRDARLAVRGEALDPQFLAALWELGVAATWRIERLQIQWEASARRDIFHLEKLIFAPRGRRTFALEATGGPTRETPHALRLAGEATFDAQPNPWRAQGALRLRLDSFPLAPVWRTPGWPGVPPVLAGEIQLGSTGAGSARAAGTLEASAPAGEKLGTAEFTAVLSPEELRFERLEVRLSELTSQVSGTMGGWLTHAPVFDLSVEVPPTHWDAASARAFARVSPAALPEVFHRLAGETRASLRVRGRWPRPALEGEVRFEQVRASLAPWPSVDNLSGHLRLRQNAGTLAARGTFLGADAWVRGTARLDALNLELRTEELPVTSLPLAELLPAGVRNLDGRVRLEVQLTGSPRAPDVTGSATLAELGFDYGEPALAVRNIGGVIEFDLERARLRELAGELGPCRFESRGQAELANWRDRLMLEITSRDCSLAFLAELAERFGGLGSATDGRNPYLAGVEGRADWHARLAGNAWAGWIETTGARWQLPNVAFPLEDIRSRVEWECEQLTVRRFAARLGSSTLELAGRVDTARKPMEWRVDAQVFLQPPEGPLFLGPLARWLQLPEPVVAHLGVGGNTASGFAWEAVLRGMTPPGNSPAPVGAPTQIELSGNWKEGTLRLDALRASLGEAKIEARGELAFGSLPRVELQLRTPPATPLPPLLRYLRLPEGLDSAQGWVEADLRVEGPLDALQFAGHATLSDLRLPEVLGEPVHIQGRFVPTREGLRLEEVRVEQPRGTFDVAGVVSWRGESRLEVQGAWLDLDGFVTAARQSASRNWFRRLSELNGSVTIAVEKMHFLGLDFAGVRAAIQQVSGTLTLRDAQFALGTGNGTGGLAVNWKNRQAAAQLQVNEIPLEAVFAVVQLPATVRAPLTARIDLRGPLGRVDSFLRESEGELEFSMPHGRVKRGTLPERLFMLAKFLHEGFYGFSFSFNWLFRALKPRNLRRFHSWTGAAALREGKAQVDSTISTKLYTLRFTGPIDLESGEVEIHGAGEYRPGFELNLSLKSLVNAFRRLFRLGRPKHSHEFEFDLTGTVRGRKSVNNFHFKD